MSPKLVGGGGAVPANNTFPASPTKMPTPARLPALPKVTPWRFCPVPALCSVQVWPSGLLRMTPELPTTMNSPSALSNATAFNVVAPAGEVTADQLPAPSAENKNEPLTPTATRRLVASEPIPSKSGKLELGTRLRLQVRPPSVEERMSP